MAQNGLAALCYDPIGQGERLQLLQSPSASEGPIKPAIKGSTSEHTMVGVGALLVGQSTAGYRIWDGIRSLDYLASRPEIDAEEARLVTGNSGGGHVDVVPHGPRRSHRLRRPILLYHVARTPIRHHRPAGRRAEHYRTSRLRHGPRRLPDDAPHAPHAGCASPRRITSINWAFWATTFRDASGLYSTRGPGERGGLFEYVDKHGFSKPRREAAMRWMRRWLLGIDDAPSEGKFAVLKDADLQCTRSGQVLADFKGVSAFGLNSVEAKKYEKKRWQFPLLAEKERVAAIRRLPQS